MLMRVAVHISQRRSRRFISHWGAAGTRASFCNIGGPERRSRRPAGRMVRGRCGCVYRHVGTVAVAPDAGQWDCSRGGHLRASLPAALVLGLRVRDATRRRRSIRRRRPRRSPREGSMRPRSASRSRASRPRPPSRGRRPRGIARRCSLSRWPKTDRSRSRAPKSRPRSPPKSPPARRRTRRSACRANTRGTSRITGSTASASISCCRTARAHDSTRDARRARQPRRASPISWSTRGACAAR